MIGEGKIRGIAVVTQHFRIFGLRFVHDDASQGSSGFMATVSSAAASAYGAAQGLLVMRIACGCALLHAV